MIYIIFLIGLGVGIVLGIIMCAYLVNSTDYDNDF